MDTVGKQLQAQDKELKALANTVEQLSNKLDSMQDPTEQEELVKHRKSTPRARDQEDFAKREALQDKLRLIGISDTHQ